jgi:predicted MFS family arabinose efflux permease
MEGPPVPTGAPGALAAFRGRAGQATVALTALRILYAVNWFDIGPGLPAIGRDLGVGPGEWGLLLAAFFAGAGLLQVPAGLLARRYGTRSVAFGGALLLGAGALGTGLAPNFATLVALRAIAGAGSGLFFSPAIALVAGLHPEGRRGVPVGVFSSAYTLGAGLGVFAGALLLAPLGWRGVLFLGGALLLLMVPLAAAIVPKDAGGAPSASYRPRGVPRAFRSRGVWVLGVAFIGLEGASLSAAQYFAPYAEIVRGWAPALAGGIAALFVFPSFFGGPLGGWLTERFSNRRAQLALFTALPAAPLVLIPWLGPGPIAAIATVFAFSFGMVYAIMYVLPPYLPELPREELPLAIGLFNGVQLAGGAVVASIAGWAVATYGYSAAWFVLGGAALATLLVLPAFPRTGSRPYGRPPGSAPEEIAGWPRGPPL